MAKSFKAIGMYIVEVCVAYAEFIRGVRMGFYDDLDFLNCGDVKQTSAARNKQPFQNYYGVQFVPSGSIRLQIGDGEVFTARGPVVFFTYPGIPFSYGSLPGEKREHLHICFRGSRAEAYAREKLIGSVENSGGAIPFISIGNSTELRQLFRKALTYLAYPGENGHARAVLALEEILIFEREAENIGDKALYRH